VQRLATIAHGDGICTTHVTARSIRRANTSGQTPRDTRGPTSTRTPAAGDNAAGDNATEVGGLSA
jgi:hypothetical protein